MARYLVVAHQTAESDELRRRLIELAAEDSNAQFVLLVPATPVNDLLVWEEGRSDEAAYRRTQAARDHLEAAGVHVVEAKVGDADPQAAIADELRSDPAYATIVVSTLPPGVSRWLRLDLPARVRRMAPQSQVIHVVGRARAEARP
ncbi:MAG TPA: hypothetical protein VI316_03710 [Candidatus Dormibacteraeota bacterium]